MSKERFKYTRKAKSSNWHEDPTSYLDEANFPYTYGETSLWKDKQYLLRVDSTDAFGIILQELNNIDWFQWSHLWDPAVLNRCNDNIDYTEWEEFTMVGDEIIDNRTFSESE